jgi:DNA-binding response OmpR family regulator
MSDKTFKIFVVDDDPVAQMITVDQLSDPRFEVQVFDNGEQCLAALDQSPDLILMDVEMPGRDGIATCHALREAGDSHAQVIFISSHDDLETHLAAYDAGGNDFILKPFAPEELAQKVRVAEQSLEQKRGIVEQAQYAQQAAMAAISYMGEQGTVIQFLRASFVCTTPGQLAATLFESLGQYGLQGLLELRDGAVAECHSSHGLCTPLEKSILSHARGMDTIFQFSDRLAINYPRVTLLVPNLPMDDPDRIGRLRDHLALIAEGAENRLQAMQVERQRLAQGEGIVRAAAELTGALSEIEAQQDKNRLRVLEVGNDYLTELERAFVLMEMTGSQEEALLTLARSAIDRYNQLQHEGKSLSDRLRQVAAGLENMVAGEGARPPA